MAENTNPNIAEYNAFGPWAYEITDKNPLPRLFAPFFMADDDAVMKIKIPREIERRNAAPGMDLYDYVIALYEDKLRILERQDENVKEHMIAAKDFLGIRTYENLLKGGCTIYSAGGSVSFPFNAVSRDLFRKFMDLAIEKLQDKDSAGRAFNASSLPVTGSMPETMFLTNLLHDVQIQIPGISVGALQKSVDVYRKDTAQNNMERMLWKEMNPEALHLYTEKNLIILENGSFPNRVGMQDFGYTFTVIPFSGIGSVEVTGSKEYSLLQECVLTLGPDQITYHFDVNNEEVANFYNTLKQNLEF